MVISRTPLSICFVGGGSDWEEFYRKENGAVISSTINKYVYITVNKKFDKNIRASYSRTEFVNTAKELKNELIREALIKMGIENSIEITSISDIPSYGTGLGSTSSYVVGLLNSLYAYKWTKIPGEQLAKESGEIEIEKCKKGNGKQNQYSAAFGGFNYIQFRSDGEVIVEPLICRKETKDKIETNLMLMHLNNGKNEKSKEWASTSKTRKFSKISNILNHKVKLVNELRDAIESNDLSSFGKILDAEWELNKKLYMSNSYKSIDKIIEKAKKSGAMGGKLIGTRENGFILLFAPLEVQDDICERIPEVKRVNFKIENEGSKIIYFGDK